MKIVNTYKNICNNTKILFVLIYFCNLNEFRHYFCKILMTIIIYTLSFIIYFIIFAPSVYCIPSAKESRRAGAAEYVTKDKRRISEG